MLSGPLCDVGSACTCADDSSSSSDEEEVELEMDMEAVARAAARATQVVAEQAAGLAAAPPAAALEPTGAELGESVQSNTPGLVFRVGDIIDAQDTASTWYNSRILAIRHTAGEPEVQVHYMGWPARWDEWIRVTSERLAPRNSRSNGAQGPTAEPVDGVFPALPVGGQVAPGLQGMQQGSIIDARDTEQNWYLSTVLDTRNGGAEVRIHFNGWSSDWDEWIPATSDRLAARNTRSAGATGPDIVHDQAARSALAGAFPGSASKFPPSAASYAFDYLMQPREAKPKTAAAAPTADASSSSSSAFTFGEAPAGGFNFAPPAGIPVFNPFATPPAFGDAGAMLPPFPSFTTPVAPAMASPPPPLQSPPTVPTSNPTGFAVRKKQEAAPMYVSASAMAPVSPPADALLDTPSFVRSGQQSLLSRVMLARLVHATERSSFASADRFKEGMELVHRILTGEARPTAPVQQHALGAAARAAAALRADPFALAPAIPPTESPPPAAAAAAAAASSSSFELVNVPTPSNSAATAAATAVPASAPSPSSLPALSFYDSSRTTILQRIIQFYSQLEDRQLRVGFMDYLPLIKARLIGSAESSNPGERPYDVDHADCLGRTTLHWIASAQMTPRPGGFLYCLMELLLSLGANPSALTNAGESAMQMLVQNAQGSFELVAPLITLLRKHGAVMTEVDEHGNTLLHRILLGSRISIGLLEDCILSALSGGFDLFAANAQGLTVFALVRLQQSLRPNDAEIRLAHEMLGSFAEQWMWEIAPWLRKTIEAQGIDRDCAAIIEQYVSGSGRPFDTADTDLPPFKPAVKLKNWQDFAIGDLIDAFDTAQKWYESTVIGVRPDAIQVHFNGWGTRWDEWIPRGSPRLAQRGSHVHAIIPAGSLVPETAGQGRGEI